VHIRGIVGKAALAAAVIGAALAATAPPAAAATTWSVATSGNNANNCTTLPCATISGVLAKPAFAAGDTINVAAGTYIDRFTLTKAVTINGAGAASTIINGNASGSANQPVIFVNATPGTSLVTINGLTIRGGQSHFGGGVSIFNGATTINDSTITANRAQNVTGNNVIGGGGIAVLGPFSGGVQSLTLNRTTVSNNTSTLHGGGIYNGGQIVMNDSTVSGNTAASQGGGVYMSRLLVTTGTPSLMTADTTTGTAVTGNSAGTVAGTAGGGVVVAANTTLSTGSLAKITGNTAVNGGGLYVAENGRAILDGTTLSGNKALGGAVAAGGNGGGIFNSGTLALQNHATLDGNQAVASTNTSNVLRGYGGAIINATVVSGGSPLLSVVNSTITGGLPAGQFNAAFGGGIAQYNAPIAAVIDNSTMTGNVGFFGGALYASAPLSVGSSAINNNTAVAGGALYANAPLIANATSTITGGTLNANLAANGGAVAVAGKGAGASPGAVVLDGVSATGNNATGGTSPTGGNGGAVFNSGDVTIRNGSTLTGSYVQASTASGAITGYGGAVVSAPLVAGDAPHATIVDSTINGGTLPTGVTSHAVFGGAIASVGNIFGASPAPVASALTLTNSTLSGTIAGFIGGGLYNGGTAIVTGTSVGNASSAFLVGGVAVIAGSTLTTTDGSISNNTAPTAGGLYVQEGGVATLTRTRLDGNKATGTLTNTGFGGAILNAGTLTVSDASISDNTATANSGQANTTGFGGAVYSGSTQSPAPVVKLTLDRVLMSANAANGGSAIWNAAPSKTSLRNSTVTGNTSNFWTIATAAPLTIWGSTIIDNTGNGVLSSVASVAGIAGTVLWHNGTACSGFVDAGYNVVDTTQAGNTCGFAAGNGDLVNVDPQLDPLASNGGPTQTRAPRPSSPVINAIPNPTSPLFNDAVTGGGFSICPGVDQRGVARPQGPACDIGAVEIGNVAPTITGPATATFVTGTVGSLSYTTTGVPTPHLSEAGALPTGVTFTDNNDGTGTLAGTAAPGSAGVYEVEITASNGNPPNAVQHLTLTVVEPLVITTTTLPHAVVGDPYSTNLAATGGTTPYTWTLNAGSLPAGLGLAANGTISGTPTGPPGSFTFDVKVVDSTNPQQTAIKTMTIVVDSHPTISGPSSATFVTGQANSVSFTSTGSPTPTLSSSGALPAGVTFTAGPGGTGTLAGTAAPGSHGVYPLVISASNGVGAPATINFTLTVLEPVAVTTTSLPDGTVGAAYNATLTANGGSPPYTWAVTTGSLPAGLSLAANGAITGTPTGPRGVSTFTVTATDSSAPTLLPTPLTASKVLSIEIHAAPTYMVADPALIKVVFPQLFVTAQTVKAHLFTTNNAPVVGASIQFKVGGTVYCTAVTDVTGTASCPGLNPQFALAMVLGNGFDAVFAGSPTLEPASAHGPVIFVS